MSCRQGKVHCHALLDALLPALVLLLVSACTATPVAHVFAPEANARTVFLIQHRWHTGIAVRRADIPAGRWPESAHYPEARYLEVGWGDRDFYPTPDPSARAALRAVLVPGPSVLHIAGLHDHPTETLPFSEVVELRIGSDGFERLVDFIAASHDRSSGSPAEAIGPGLYLDSHFYPALGSFHLFNNCNTWVVEALRAAGLPMQWAITSTAVMEQARRLGRSIRPAEHRGVHLDLTPVVDLGRADGAVLDKYRLKLPIMELLSPKTQHKWKRSGVFSLTPRAVSSCSGHAVPVNRPGFAKGLTPEHPILTTPGRSAP